MFNEHTTSTQVVTKVYGVEQGAPWVVHEVFKPRGITNTFAFIYSLTRTIPPETDLLTRTPFRPAQRLQKAWLSSFHSQSPSQSIKASINLEIDEQKSSNFDFGTAHTGATYNHYHGTEREANKDFYDLFPAPSSTSQLLSRAYQLFITDPPVVLARVTEPISQFSKQSPPSIPPRTMLSSQLGNPMTNLPSSEERMAMIELLHNTQYLAITDGTVKTSLKEVKVANVEEKEVMEKLDSSDEFEMVEEEEWELVHQTPT
ncbi:hypothetical protein D6C76_03031 [Aureobasidium pullulans]|nr:hypothetical protein D6C76_03031 [Aureobasidium pullulans]